MRNRFGLCSALVVALVALSPSARAGHHLWRLTELFSNASGSVQFAELFTADAGENSVGPFSVTTSAGKTFNFVTSLPAATSTANTWILLGTSNLASLAGGIAPDYTIPANFFATGGGTINYAGVDNWAYGALPADGVHSLQRDGTSALNSPRNFAGQAGSLTAAAATAAPLPGWAIAAVVGLLLLLGSGLLRRQKTAS